MIVDINSNPFVSRKKLLAAILKKMLRKKRVIIMGDFNTPYNSVFFDEYKSKFFHAFQKAGSGFDATWPYGIPLLHIDHIWISKDMKPLKLRKKYHLISDHAKLDLEIGI